MACVIKVGSHFNNYIFYSYLVWFHWAIGIMVSVHQWSRRAGFNPRLSHTKDSKIWYLMLPCLTLSIIRYGSRRKWSNPRKGVAPSPTPQCSRYGKGSLRVTLNYGRQLYLLYMWYKNASSQLFKIGWHFIIANISNWFIDKNWTGTTIPLSSKVLYPIVKYYIKLVE